jgi:hypothetical protein
LGQAITFIATVTGTGGNTPTGTVTFLDGQYGRQGSPQLP